MVASQIRSKAAGAWGAVWVAQRGGILYKLDEESTELSGRKEDHTHIHTHTYAYVPGPISSSSSLANLDS